MLGRVFSTEDFRPGGEHVIMIGNALWQERFGASPSVLGKTIRVSAANSGETPTEYRIIGVLPPGFRYVGNYIRDPADTAMPLTPHAGLYGALACRACPRLCGPADHRSCAECRVGHPLAGRASDWNQFTRTTVATCALFWLASPSPLRLVLLIVVTNIAVLMLLRALRRQKETAVRVVLGAEPHRIARLLLRESVLICGIALVAGVALTTITLRALGPQIEARLGRPVPGGVSALAMDGTVLLWIGGIGFLIAVVVAWLPMIGTRPARLADSLRSEGRSSTDRPVVRRARTALIALEVAASTALLIAGGLMLRSVAHLMSTNLGYETNHVFRPRLQLPTSKYRDATPPPSPASTIVWRNNSPPSRIYRSHFRRSCRSGSRPNSQLETGQATTPNLAPASRLPALITFDTLGIGLREGRAFTPGTEAAPNR